MQYRSSDKMVKISNRKSRVPASTFSLGRRSSMGHMRQPVMRFAPTYRLEPTIPFNKEAAETILENVMNHFLDGFTYRAKTASHLCKGISEEVKTRIRLQKADRYRIICVVTIGQMRMQGFNATVSFLWDATKDQYVSYTYDKPNVFAIGTVYAVYYD